MLQRMHDSVIHPKHIKVLAGRGAGESGFFQEAGSPAFWPFLPPFPRVPRDSSWSGEVSNSQ
jgi:hypothetical protein